MAKEEDAEFNDKSATNAAIRNAKKALRPTKVGLPEAPKTLNPKKDKKRRGKPSALSKKKSITKLGKSGLGFGKDASEKRSSGTLVREGARAKKTDAIGGMKKGVKSGKRK